MTNQNGEVIKRTDWMAFGEEVEFNKRTTGLEDEESGLDFAQARYYNPKHGRYTSVDPLTASANVKNPQTFNRYSYVLNSPYKFTDPLGLIAETTGACGTRCQGSNGPSLGLIRLYTGMSGNFADPKRQTQQPTLAHEIEHAKGLFADQKAPTESEIEVTGRTSNPIPEGSSVRLQVSGYTPVSINNGVVRDDKGNVIANAKDLGSERACED